MTIKVFQLKDEPRNAALMFLSSDKVREIRGEIDPTDYRCVFKGKVLPVRLTENDSYDLDAIYERYQSNLPSEWTGHSLSVGDIICLYTRDWTKLFFVEPIGFSDITDELKENERRHIGNGCGTCKEP